MNYLTVSLALCSSATAVLVPGPWSNLNDPPENRAKALLANMTLAEKLSMLHGPATGDCCSCNTSASCAYVGNINPIERLGIPPTNMNDGPQGFRDNVHPGTTTAWPSGLTMAATWDVEAMSEWGIGMGKEFYAKGANVQLGPGLCLARVPRNGRNFEYLSGEDPFLGYTLVQPVITGIQSQKVVANAKHYAFNNQETNRGSVSEEVDERTRFEMYYPAFAGAINAGVGSIMCSYNKINGIWSCENPVTLKHDLKNYSGFKGYVMSDWGATHSTSIAEGLDVEMPQAHFMNADSITAGLKSGSIKQADIDDSVERILYSMFAVGVMDEPLSAWDWKKQSTNSTTEASVASARKLSGLSTVLLKNQHSASGPTLPLPTGTNKVRANSTETLMLFDLCLICV
jgi:beta-glucosidase